MAFAPIPEYEGKSPYVFISYAPQDEKIAYAIAVKMHNEGFRLWSSAACGNPSTMRIAERLSNSFVAMVFLSKSYLKIASQKEFEPRAVMNSPKQKIVICLDDTPLGTDWNTVDFPAGIRYNPDVPQGMWLRINSSDALEKCRGAWPRRPMPEPFEEKPRVDMSSVDEEELTDELTSLNSVMQSFGAGLDDEEIKNISLFRKDYGTQEKFKWPDQSEPSEEQEYYSIQNLIGNSPMTVSPEKKQYDSMIGLIESFMEKSSRVREEERERLERQAEESRSRSKMPISRNTYGEYRAVPKNEFDTVDLSKDTSSAPVVITESSAPVPIILDYGDESDIPAYSMTRSAGRAERVSELIFTPPAPQPVYNEVDDNEKPAAETPRPKEKKEPHADRSEPVFEKIVDDRKFIKSTDDNIEDAKLTYHLGNLFDGFDENDFVQDEPEPPKPEVPKPEVPKAEVPKPEAPKPELPKIDPARFREDSIPLPTISFEKPRRPELPEIETKPAPPPKKRTLSKPRRRYIVSVRKGVRHIEYDEEMYEVNGRWIPGNIYHRLMPNAKYTAIRRISHTARTETPAPAAPPVQPSRPAAVLNNDNLLRNAASTFISSSKRSAPSGEGIPEDVRSVLRERHEMRRNEGIRQFEENAAAAQPTPKNTPAPDADGENVPARKHKFSHEGGIKKSLFYNMESPVNTNVEESHRQHGARAAAAAEAAGAENAPQEESGGKKSKKKDDKAAKKAAKKAAEKAAQKKAESKKGDKKGKNKKDAEEEKLAPAPQPTPSAFTDTDDDSPVEIPGKNLPNLHYDPAAYRTMNLSEILFGERGGEKTADRDQKDQKKKKKK